MHSLFPLTKSQTLSVTYIMRKLFKSFVQCCFVLVFQRPHGFDFLQFSNFLNVFISKRHNILNIYIWGEENIILWNSWGHRGVVGLFVNKTYYFEAMSRVEGLKQLVSSSFFELVVTAAKLSLVPVYLSEEDREKSREQDRVSISRRLR